MPVSRRAVGQRGFTAETKGHARPAQNSARWTNRSIELDGDVAHMTRGLPMSEGRRECPRVLHIRDDVVEARGVRRAERGARPASRTARSPRVVGIQWRRPRPAAPLSGTVTLFESTRAHGGREIPMLVSAYGPAVARRLGR